MTSDGVCLMCRNDSPARLSCGLTVYSLCIFSIKTFSAVSVKTGHISSAGTPGPFPHCHFLLTNTREAQPRCWMGRGRMLTGLLRCERFRLKGAAFVFISRTLLLFPSVTISLTNTLSLALHA